MFCDKWLALEGCIGQRNTFYHLVACQEQINGVIHENGHIDRIDWYDQLNIFSHNNCMVKELMNALKDDLISCESKEKTDVATALATLVEPSHLLDPLRLLSTRSYQQIHDICHPQIRMNFTSPPSALPLYSPGDADRMRGMFPFPRCAVNILA